MEKKMTEYTNEQLLDKLLDLAWDRGTGTYVPLQVTTDLRTELLRRLGAAVSAPLQPRMCCPKCGGNVVLRHVHVGHSFCGVQCPKCMPDGTWWINSAEELAPFFAPAPAQEPRCCDFTGEHWLGCPNAGKDTAAQPVENSSRCRFCGEVEANYRHDEATATASPQYYHKFQSISGGASTVEQPPESVKLVSKREPTPEEIDLGKALDPMAKECLERNRARPSGPSAPKVEPVKHPCPKCGAEGVRVCLGCGIETDKRDCGCPAGTGYKCSKSCTSRPTQATETASAPDPREIEARLSMAEEYEQELAKILYLLPDPSSNPANETIAERMKAYIESLKPAAPSVAGTQPTPDGKQICDNCGRQLNQHYTMANFCDGDKPGKVFRGAAQGTPQVEAAISEIVQYFKDLHSVTYEEMHEDFRHILRKHGVGAPAQPGPEEKR